MTPFPIELQKKCPSHLDQHDHRPWWKWDEEAELWVRTDFSDASDEGEILAIDCMNPLPHPGFRAGQIWGDQHGNTVTLVSSIGGLVCWISIREGVPVFVTSPEGEVFLRYCYLVADPVSQHLAPWSPV